MTRFVSIIVLTGGLTAGQAAQAEAQDQAAAPPRQPAASRPQPAAAAGPRFRAYGEVDFTWMAASQSFEAVLGSSSLTGFGGGFELIRLWRGAFARVSFTVAGGSGSRVIVVDNQVVDMGVPVDVGMGSLSLGGGWRQSVHRRFLAYGGAAFVRLSYSEESPFSGNESTSAGFPGFAIFGGVEMPLGRVFFVGGEAEWRTIPDAIGESETSVSRAYGETNLGGTTIRVLFGIRK
jgi:hypothetical protein